MPSITQSDVRLDVHINGWNARFNVEYTVRFSKQEQDMRAEYTCAVLIVEQERDRDSFSVNRLSESNGDPYGYTHELWQSWYWEGGVLGDIFDIGWMGTDTRDDPDRVLLRRDDRIVADSHEKLIEVTRTTDSLWRDHVPPNEIYARVLVVPHLRHAWKSAQAVKVAIP